MESRLKYKIAWIVSLVLLTVMSGTFLVMPFTADRATMEYKTPLVIVGAVFWFSLLGGYLTFLITSIIRKKKKPLSDERIGFIKLYSSPVLAYIDTTFLMAIIWGIVNVISDNTDNYVMYINIFILILSFNLHCLCSSNLYRYIFGRERR